MAKHNFDRYVSDLAGAVQKYRNAMNRSAEDGEMTPRQTQALASACLSVLKIEGKEGAIPFLVGSMPRAIQKAREAVKKPVLCGEMGEDILAIGEAENARRTLITLELAQEGLMAIKHARSGLKQEAA